MPELPEVETTCRGISPHISQEMVSGIVVRQQKLRWPIPLEFIKPTLNKTLIEVRRRGKYLLLFFEHGYWLVHLGMSGSLRIVDHSVPVQKHDHVDMVFSNGKILRYNDPRRFGCWLFHDEKESNHPLLARLGHEPLEPQFDGDYLYSQAQSKKGAIKPFLMNSKVVVGVGNIYASESLFMAGIHPKRVANKVSRMRYQLLAEHIKTVLQKAINSGGTTLKDFVNSDGKPGYFQQSLAVYGREGELCQICEAVIKRCVLGQRSTFYCASCQH